MHFTAVKAFGLQLQEPLGLGLCFGDNIVFEKKSENGQLIQAC